MASIKEVSQDIKDTFGSSFINSTQAGRFLGMSKEKTAQFLSGIPVYPTGKEKKFFVNDIARRLENIRAYKLHG